MREFKLTTLALKNKISIFFITFIIILLGLTTYVALPKALYPDIVLPTILVQTIYPGNPPVDIENLISRPIEKELESVKDVRKISSTSSQGASMVMVEFNFDVDISDALSDVKDAVDKVKGDLPNDLPRDPLVMDIDFSEFPFINLNLSGDYSVDELKVYGEIIEDEVEKISEVSKVNIMGIAEKEVEINVDMQKINAMQVNFKDIENAIAYENMSVSGGEVVIGGTKRSIRTIGEFKSIDDIKDIVVKAEKGNIIYLKNVADVKFKYEDPKSFARLNKKPVISLQVIKKGGENLLDATAKLEATLETLKKENRLPEDLIIEKTNDQSDKVKKQLSSLENNMIMSIIFVILILFFFLGTRNALFVGIAIPLSMFISFITLSLIGYQINMVVLFSLILALGMLVDNAIVVVENIYRFIGQGETLFEASKKAVGEISTAIIASTATTLSAFLPLAFWDSMMGEFMKYLPITLIIVLTSSLFVALVLVPVFSMAYSKKDAQNEPPKKKRAIIIGTVLMILSIITFILKLNVFGNLFGIASTITFLNLLVMNSLSNWFQTVALSKLENGYLKFLKFALRKYNPIIFFVSTFFLMILTIGLYFGSKPKVKFFPDAQPSFINVLAELPVGTDIMATDNFMNEMENYIKEISTPYSPIIKSILTNVGEGAVLPNDLENIGQKGTSNKGLITITFIDYEKRNGLSSSEALKMLSNKLIGKYPGVTLTVEKNRSGPPTGKPINIEISGDEFAQLIETSEIIQEKIKNSNIKGIEGIKQNLNTSNPELIISINRRRARSFGMSTGQIASTIRTALFGKEISNFKVGEDEYPIQLRLDKKYRNDIPALLNQKITFMNKRGKMMQIPISAVTDIDYGNTYGAVKRKELKRTITLFSNALEGYNANEINKQLKELLKDFKVENIDIKFTGEQEDQKKSMAFLINAFGIAILLIFVILIMQFNSIVKPLIILSSVLLSTIGVFGGLAIFNMEFIVIMTGIGIVSLAGVVVNNAIVLVDYIDLLKSQEREKLNLEADAKLPIEITTQCIVVAGKTRLRPVLLTAITTILGLIPMAIGLNIDFTSYLSTFDAQIYFGGDMAAMWAPMSWTVIFGLTFATFLTLVIVPVMYHIGSSTQLWVKRIFA